MTDSSIKITIDPSGTVAGANTINASLRGIGTNATAMAQQLTGATGTATGGLNNASNATAGLTTRMANLGAAAMKAGGAMTLGLTAPLVAFGKHAVDAASDFQELQAASGETFGKMGADMEKWAETTGNAMGRSTKEMMQGAQTLGLLFNQSAPTAAEAAKLSQSFTVLSQDLSSFFNTKPEEALNALRAGLTGEAEPLRKYGVFLSEAALQSKAAQMGIKGVGGALTDQQKIMVRSALIMDATKKAQGDVMRTSDSYANQLRRSQAAYEELSITVGTKLLPALTPLVETLGSLAEKFTSLSPTTQSVIIGVAGFAAVAGPLLMTISGLITVVPALVTGIGALATGFGVFTGFLTTTAIPTIGMLAGILSPILLPIAAIAAAVGALYLVWKNWDQIKVILSNLWNAVSSYLGSKLTAIFNGVKSAVMMVYNFYASSFTNMIGFASKLYSGVKTWIMDKLGAIWKWLMDKLGAVGRAFYKLYDAVVGHSYIPDMVDQIGQHIGRLDGLMVNKTIQQTKKVSKAYQELQEKTKGIMDGLFPDSAALTKIADDIKTLQAAAKQDPTNAANYEAGIAKLGTQAQEIKDRRLGLTAMRSTADALEDEINLKKMLVGMTKEIADIEGPLLKQQLTDARAGIDVTTDQYKAEQQRLRGLQQITAEMNKQSGMSSDDLKALQNQYSPTAARLDKQSALKKQLEEYQKNYKGDTADIIYTETVAGLQAAIKETAGIFRDEFGTQINNLANAMGALFGERIGNGIAAIADAVKLFKSGGLSLDDARNGKGGPVAQLLSSVQGIGSQIKGSLGALFSPTGAIGKALGKMSSGAAMGNAITPIGQAVWSKFSGTGAQIGGAIGSMLPFLGPFGSVIGSFIGGTIGGLFKKSKKAEGNLRVDSAGTLSLQGMTGNNQKAKDALASFSENVTSTVTQIAQRLGGVLGGSSSLNVKVKDDKFTVDGKKFEKDSQAAAAYSIQKLIQSGVIMGLSSFSDRLLRSSSNLDSAVALAESYENLLDGLAKLENPFKASIEELTTGIDKMLKQMTAAGATAAELGNVTRYRDIQLKKILEDQNADLLEFKTSLFGEGSGRTAYNRLQDDLAKLEAFKADITAGKSIDQAAFLSLVSRIDSGRKDVLGTATEESVSLRDMLAGFTQQAIDNNQSQADALISTTIQQTSNDQITAINGVASRLDELIALARANGTYVDTGITGIDRAFNGAINGIYY